MHVPETVLGILMYKKRNETLTQELETVLLKLVHTFFKTFVMP